MTIHQPVAVLRREPASTAGETAFERFAVSRPDEPRRRRMLAMAAVAGLHGALLLGFLLHPGLIAVTLPDTPLSVSILADAPEPEPEPQPPPRAKDLRPPTPMTITVPLLPANEEPTSAITPPPPSPPPAAAPKHADSYYAHLFAHLNRYKRYPDDARAKHQEGTVMLRFVMDRAGNVLSFSIAQSSGLAALDAEVRDLIRRAEPLPPLPADMPQNELDLVIPVDFSLGRR